MSNLQLAITGGLVFWVVAVSGICAILGANKRTRDQDDKAFLDILRESRPMPLDEVCVNALAATRRVRAGS